MKKALVIGGYGLIGKACVSALEKADFTIIGIGRSHEAAQRTAPHLQWIIKDLTTLSVEQWRTYLEDVDVVVNAAGALQDSPRDNLDAIHIKLVDRLSDALHGQETRLIQISAAGVGETSSTPFFRTKAQGDAIIQNRVRNYVILRPTLVLSSEAYGGTALLRAVAALPITSLNLYSQSKIQTVFVEDLAQCVVQAARGDIPSGTVADITEKRSHTFPDLVAKIQYWQGFPPTHFNLAVPTWALSTLGKLADGFGLLGWRTPLRSTALKVLDDGIQGDGNTWTALGGHSCRPLEETLKAIPATHQERLFARAYFALPLAIGTLSGFWLISGLIAVFNSEPALNILRDRNADERLSYLTVYGGAIADIGLGVLILWRSWARRTCLAMCALAVSYLFGSAVFASDLWLDPLGPMVKVIPSITLALLVWLLMDDT